ncbi:MAG: hypothetical protein LBS63_03770 [Prevotellaceae bacterium]|nr:hypothetical protein [Prevotellaceae bacterium]
MSAIVISLLTALSLWAPNFIAPLQVKDNVPMMPLEQWLMALVELSPLASTVAAFLLTYLLAAMLFRMGVAHFFSQEQKYFPPFVMVLICSAFPVQKCLNGSYIAALFFMLGLFHLLKVYRSERVFVSIFTAAIYLSVASLFSASAIFLLLLFPVALPLLHAPTSWRDWVIALCGVGLPYLYASAFFFLAEGNALLIFHRLYECLFQLSSWIFENGRMEEWVYWGYLLLLVALAMLMLTREMLTSHIKEKKIYTLFIWGFFIMLVVLVALPSGSVLLMPLMAIPASVLISNYLSITRYRFLASVMFWGLIALTYVVQYCSVALST